jgi:hypothetical protein
MIAVLQGRACSRQERAKAYFPLLERARADGFPIEVEEVEQEKGKSVGVARVRRRLDQAERGRAIGSDAAQLPIEISLPG